jgi:GAF domain-containing protein
MTPSSISRRINTTGTPSNQRMSGYTITYLLSHSSTIKVNPHGYVPRLAIGHSAIELDHSQGKESAGELSVISGVSPGRDQSNARAKLLRLDDVTLDRRYRQHPQDDGSPPGYQPVRSSLAVPIEQQALQAQ